MERRWNRPLHPENTPGPRNVHDYFQRTSYRRNASGRLSRRRFGRLAMTEKAYSGGAKNQSALSV